MITTTCSVCGAEVAVDVDGPIWEYIKRYAPNCVAKYTCDPCAKQVAESRKAEMELRKELDAIATDDMRSEHFEQLWRGFCPGEFCVFDPSRYPRESQKSLERVMAWDGGKKGLLLHGPTGMGKTVAVWTTLKPWFFREYSIQVFTANEFAITAAKLASESSDKADRWLHNLKRSNILFIDDIGKRKMAEFSEAQLFDVIDYRYKNGLPMIFTCEGNADWLKNFIGESRRDGMIRRIQDSCIDIRF